MKRPLIAAAISLVCMAACAQAAKPNPLAEARVFPYDQMVARTAPNGTVSRNVFRGTLATGESVAAH